MNLITTFLIVILVKTLEKHFSKDNINYRLHIVNLWDFTYITFRYIKYK